MASGSGSGSEVVVITSPPPPPPQSASNSPSSSLASIREQVAIASRSRTGYAEQKNSVRYLSSSPRSVASTDGSAQLKAKVAMAAQYQSQPQRQTTPSPPPAVEPQNPFDQFGGGAAADAAFRRPPTLQGRRPPVITRAASESAASYQGGGNFRDPRVPPTTMAFDPHAAAATSTAPQQPLGAGKGVFGVGAPSALHPLGGSGGSAGASHTLLASSGSSAGSAFSPHPLLTTSGSSAGTTSSTQAVAGAGGVERKNPFDDFLGPAPPSSLPPRHAHGHRPRGHHATQSLGLPSDFSAMNLGRSSKTSSPVLDHKHTPQPSSVPGTHATNAEAAAALKDLAASLSAIKPRAMTQAEQAEEAKMLNRLTLGEQPKESTGTKKSHRRKASMNSVRGKMKGALKDSVSVMKGQGHHRKGSSLDASAMGNIMNEINDAGGGTKLGKDDKKSSMMGLSSLVMTPKGFSKKKLMSAGPLTPNASKKSLTPKTSKSGKHVKDKNKGGNASGASSRTSTPNSSMHGTGNGKAPDNGLGDADSPVERKQLSPIMSSTFGGLGDSMNIGAGAVPPPPPLDLPDIDFSTPAAAAPAKTTSLAYVNTAPGGAFASACSYATSSDVGSMRSSEQDPAPHQMDIGPSDDFLVHARTCAVMDSYRVIDQNFNFGALVGRSRMFLEGFVNPVSVDVEEDEDESDAAAMNGTADEAVLVERAHRPIVSSVLNCADDLVVEGFLHEMGGAGEVIKKDSDHGTGSLSMRPDKSKKKAEEDTGVGRDKSTDDRVECAVFYSHRRRQIIASWRGTTADQAKPVRNRHLRAWKEKWDRTKDKSNLCNLASADGKDCAVFPPYLDSYLNSDLERRVFALLNELSDRHTFCDVVMTGHSFGAALATLAAVRYASSRPMMRVLCQCFGSPRVGDAPFRHWANSLPNLRVMRVEYGADPWVYGPEGMPWTHAGHSIAVDGATVAALAGERGDVGPVGKDAESKSEKLSKAVPVRAYRFDKHRPGSDSGGSSAAAAWIGQTLAGHHHHHGEKGKADHELRAYVAAIERISSLGLRWPRDFVGEDVGRGVKGSGKEKRLVV